MNKTKLMPEKQIIEYEFTLPVKINKFEGKPQLIHTFPHFHGYEIEIQFIVEGDGFYFIKNRKYNLERKKVLIIHKGEIHYYIQGKKEIEKVTIMLKSSVFDKFKNLFLPILNCKKNSSHEVFLSDRDFLISQILLEEIIEKKGKYIEETIKFNLLKFFLIILQNLKKEKLKAKNEKIAKIIDFIEENYFRKISINEVASIFKISNSHLSHLFKRETGMSFKKYIIERRLFESEKLLQGENTKISSIAKKCGFSDMTFFMKKFKEKFGITPLQYKNIIKKEGL
jgi:AraC-like DNA-binding protein/quercetin dioxygenase-like cupin family protein